MKMFNQVNNHTLGLIHVAIAITIMIVMITLSPSHLIYDESFHLEGAELLIQGKSINEMLLAPLQSAPGPLYPILHAFLFPLTRLQAPYIRWINPIFLIISTIAISFCLKSYGITRPFYRSTAIFSVPMFWVTSGMALTEIPAFTMATFSLLTATFAVNEEASKRFTYVYFMLSGLFAGIAILGRQTYLPMILVFLVLSYYKPAWRWSALSAFLIAFFTVLPVFLTWGGLVPKSQSNVGGGIDVSHGLLAISYLGIVVAILAPSFFSILLKKWKLLLGAIFLMILANLTLFQFKFKLMMGLVKYVPIPEDFYSIIMGSLLITTCITFVLATFLNVLDRYENKLFLLMTGLTILSVSTSFGITHLFSSRYIMTCFPFVLIMIQPFYSPSRWTLLRFVLGGLFGILTLASYYTFKAT